MPVSVPAQMWAFKAGDAMPPSPAERIVVSDTIRLCVFPCDRQAIEVRRQSAFVLSRANKEYNTDLIATASDYFGRAYDKPLVEADFGIRQESGIKCIDISPTNEGSSRYDDPE